MFISQGGGNPSLWRTINETQLKQIRFHHIHDRIRFFAYRCCNGRQPHRSTTIFFDNGLQHPPIHFIQTHFIYSQQIQGLNGNLTGDKTVRAYLRKIPYAAKQAQRHPRCTTGTSRNFRNTRFISMHCHHDCRPVNNLFHCWLIVIIKAVNCPKPGTQWCCYQCQAGCGADGGKSG